MSQIIILGNTVLVRIYKHFGKVYLLYYLKYFENFKIIIKYIL